jgi:alkanesulfonate monooxygenase SsuD/methylene tetrahydromethanopterin reductase-like flavin-dependent oxidoreductase (luciferase family)
MTFRPTPVQQPRIPIWVVGAWGKERSVARALRFDGILPQTSDPADIRAVAARAAHERPADPVEIVVEGTTPEDPQDARSAVGPLAEAGATWWIESDWTSATVDSLRKRIAAGPPAVSG